MISRTLEDIIKERINKGKAIIVVGPRQVGKTTLVQHILKEKFKWNPKAKTKIPEKFVDTYKATFKIINKDDFRDFLL